ncbi:hypothetical protein ACH5RR_012830 [Cinchona calisaya]|uniref:Uncharacterized protein n=1 Tax=Cinchona calisaya TaxID=153742 RepID=A0ABD3A8Y9_9GENT
MIGGRKLEARFCPTVSIQSFRPVDLLACPSNLYLHRDDEFFLKITRRECQKEVVTLDYDIHISEEMNLSKEVELPEPSNPAVEESILSNSENREMEQNQDVVKWI